MQASKYDTSSNAKLYIAIVGGGPKGMYGLERVTAQFTTFPVEREVEIHIFNRSAHFGSGEIYCPSQPDYLKMNISKSEIDMWLKEEPKPVVSASLSFLEWAKNEGIENIPDFPSRSMVGRYLENGFEQIKNNLPSNIQLKQFVGEVENIEKYEGGYQIILCKSTSQFSSPNYQYILLATGHPRPQLSEEERKYLTQKCSNNEARFVPFIYPVETELNGITGNSTVAVKGMGLTFVDAVLALTEGRGGKFEEAGEKLEYHPSGKEPRKILPFSRSGLPMIPRAAKSKAKESNFQFFTSEAVENIKQSPEHKHDFETEIWPLIRQEMTYAYYKVLFNKYAFPRTPSHYSSFSALEKDIRRFRHLHPNIQPLSIDDFFNPVKKMNIVDGKDFHQFIHDYFQMLCAEATLGAERSPLVALSQVWSEATQLFGQLFQFGGLTPESQKTFTEKYMAAFNRNTYGPPVISMRKIIALAESGILDFSIGPCESVGFDDAKNQFSIVSSISHQPFEVDYLIDARIPKTSIANATEGLYFNLLKKGEISVFQNTCEKTKTTFSPGCLALNDAGQVIDGEGRVNPSITVMGTPTEGITYDNDALTPHRNNFVSHWAKMIRTKIENETFHYH